jgi:hypothetical protein
MQALAADNRTLRMRERRFDPAPLLRRRILPHLAPPPPPAANAPANGPAGGAPAAAASAGGATAAHVLLVALQNELAAARTLV